MQLRVCTLLQTFFLGSNANYYYLCINKKTEPLIIEDMILTNRELFLLIICTIFYITLFILVLQNNRRKIQLLQSRLDNIHQMQKMAVIEQRPDVGNIFATAVYQRIKQYLNEGKSMAEGDWPELADAVNTVYTGFTDKLYSLYRMSEQDYRVSLLIKIRLQPKDIATLTAHSKESIASTRSRLYQKVFGKKGSTKDWDDFILSI